MKHISSFIKTTLIGGLFFITPLVLLVYLISIVIGVLRKMVAPIADKIEFSLFGGEGSARIIALVILLILCFIAGLLAKTKIANQVKEWVEANILSNIPGYTLLKGTIEAAAGFESKNLKEVVLVDIEEVWQIGFLMERIDNDLNTVFIPGAPDPMSGSVVFVKWDRLKTIDIKEIDAMQISRKMGIDSKKILDGKMNKSIFEKE